MQHRPGLPHFMTSEPRETAGRRARQAQRESRQGRSGSNLRGCGTGLMQLYKDEDWWEGWFGQTMRYDLTR